MYFVFDIGNVLFSWNPDIFLAKYFPDDVMRLKQMIFLGEEWKRLDLGELSLQEVEILLSERYVQDQDAIHFIFDHFQEEMMQPIDDSIKTVKALKKKGYKLYLLSNLNQERYYKRYQQHPDIFSLFDGVTLSGGVHELKPDQSIYLKFFHQFHLEPSNGLLIDDNLANIQTAQRLGMQTLLSLPQQNLTQRLKAMGIDTIP